tara:strand:+ start:144 stop:1082 length:939 start_codon:yes stop_codon:yes gene_type:complete
VGKIALDMAWIFPGQGSQHVGMGSDIFLDSEIAKNYFEKAHDILGYDIQSIILNGPDETLRKTLYTQPSIYILSVITGKILISKGIRPVVVAGHSLGEYSALAISGAFSFSSGLKIVKIRAEQMELASRSKNGTMAAIIGLNIDKVIELCSSNKTNEIVVPANFNSPNQVVISGSEKGVLDITEKAKIEGAKLTVLLNVGGAFHSPLMKTARVFLAEALDSIKFCDTICPIYTNADAKPHSTSLKIKDLLLKQLESPVLWSQTISAIKDDMKIIDFMEVGPGKVLSGLNKRINKTLKTIKVGTLKEINNINV